MRATLDDPLLDAELAGVGQGERTMQHEGQSFLGKPHYDEIILAFDVPDGAVESKALHRAVALARKHGWPLKQSEHSVRDDEFWSCTKELPGGHRAELSAYLVQGGPSGFFHNGVEEVDPTKVVFVIQPLDPALR